MPETHSIDRRRVLTAGATATLGVWSALGGRVVRAQEPSPGAAAGDDRALYLVVQIPGLPEASRNIRDVAIDELNIDAREMTTGLDVEYRIIRPGSAHFGSATFKSVVSAEGTKELRTWFEEARTGKNIRKNIIVSLYKSDKTPGRSFNLLDCFPTSYSYVNFDTSSTVQTETLTVKIGRIEFKV